MTRHLIAAAIAAALLLAPATAAARTITIREHADLHLVRKSGSTLYQSGRASGTIDGNVSTVFNVTLSGVTGQFTIYARGGSLTLSVNGKPRSTGIRARFSGTMRVVKGTGRYSGASGSGNFSGTVNRRTWAASVDASGRLTY